jgi:hypothetical protein
MTELSNIELIGAFQCDLNAFMDEAVKKGLTVSAKPNKNFLYIGEFLEQYKLARLFSESEFALKDAVTFKDLLTRSVSIHKTCSFLQQEIDVIKKGNRKISEEERAFLNSLITLRDCFQLVRTAINKKHAKRKAEEPLFFCALCWKRVRVSDQSEYSDRKDSTFYCTDHLPNKSEHLYGQDKTKLFRAMKSKDNRFLNELQRYEKASFKTSFSLPPTYYKWLASLSPKPSVLLGRLQIHIEQHENWKFRANRLTELSQNVYPVAYEKIKELDATEYSLIESWVIDGIVYALDESKEKSEVQFWKQEEATRIKLSSFLITQGNLSRDTPEDESSNEYLMLVCSLLSRYEAYHIVKNIPQPRGGGNEKDEILRSKIKWLREHNIRTTGRQNVKLIAESFSKSKTRIYKILKEFDSSDK